MKKVLFTAIILFISIILIGCNENEEKTSLVLNHGGKEGFLPTVIIRGSTNCGHCVKAMPIFEEKVFNKYGDKIKVSLNTLGDNLFQTSIPQTTGSELEFEKYTNEKCEYIPTRIVLDKEGNVAEKSCGGQKELSDLIVSLEFLLKK